VAEVRLACPTCGKETVVDDAEPLPPDAPFCSERCRYVELANWYDDKYRVARPVDETDAD
jgi:endogenous inhibitor of DNA gyrase (YacG/DUF329 family)